jgi:hypothetical protein
MSQFPPPIIVDMFYGCAALLLWGIPQASDAILLSAGSLYYDETGPGEPNPPGEAGDGGDDTEGARSPTPMETHWSKRAKVWANRHRDGHSEPHLAMDEVMDLVLLLWSRSGPKHQEKPPPTQAELLRQDRVKLSDFFLGLFLSFDLYLYHVISLLLPFLIVVRLPATQVIRVHLGEMKPTDDDHDVN